MEKEYPYVMHGLSLSQPYATLMALGEKRFETRGWSPPRDLIGQLVAIHSSKKYPEENMRMVREDAPFYMLMGKHGLVDAELPLGQVVAVGRLMECYTVHNLNTGTGSVMRSQSRTNIVKPIPYGTERELGDYSDNRRVWEFSGVVPLKEPLHARGNIGCWALSSALQEEIARQLRSCGWGLWATEIEYPSLIEGKPTLVELMQP